MQDIPLPPEELQILQEVSSPSQVISERVEPDERKEDGNKSENEQVEKEKDENLGNDRQGQDSQQSIGEEPLEKPEQVKDSMQRDKEYKAELHQILGAPFADSSVPPKGLMAQVVYDWSVYGKYSLDRLTLIEKEFLARVKSTLDEVYLSYMFLRKKK